MNTDFTPKLDPLSSDVQRAISGAEDMLRQASSSTGEKAAELRERALDQLKHLRETLHGAQEAVVERSKYAARVTDDYVHDHPWQSVGAAIGVGVVIGLLLSSRR